MKQTPTQTLTRQGNQINAINLIREGGQVNIIRSGRQNTIIVEENDDPIITALFTLLSTTTLNPMDEATALAAILREGQYSQKQLHELLGLSQSQISKRLLLRKLIPPLQQRLKEKTIKASVARELAKLTPEQQQPYIQQEKITVAEMMQVRRQQFLSTIDLTEIENNTPTENPLQNLKNKIQTTLERTDISPLEKNIAIASICGFQICEGGPVR